MNFSTPLVRGQLVQRYKRFLADIMLDDGTEITAHCPNPGAMIGLNRPGLVCWLSKSPDPARKLPYTWELVEAPSHDGDFLPVGVNTMHPNRLVAEALASDAIAELAGYATHRREVKYGVNSRVDFLLEGPGLAPAWVEAKGVTLSRRRGLAEWPDCVSARGTRHLAELEARIQAGDRAVVLFVVQRSDCTAFDVARDLDPGFGRAWERVRAAGVEALVYGCDLSSRAVTLRPAAFLASDRIGAGCAT